MRTTTLLVTAFLTLQATVTWSQTKPQVSPQVSPPVSRDGGMPAVRMVDAGIVEPLVIQSNVNAAAVAANTAELDKLRKEVTELKTRSAEFEKQQRAKADALTDEMAKLTEKLEAMRKTVKDLSQADEQRTEHERDVATRRAQIGQATATLNQAIVQLASGNTGGVEAALRMAEASLTGNAQRDVQLARGALQQGDLWTTRQFISLALVEAEGLR